MPRLRRQASRAPIRNARSSPAPLCFYGRSLHLDGTGVVLASIRNALILGLLTLIEGAEAGLFNGRDVNENVFSSSLRLNKPIAFHRVEPLHSAACHRRSPC